MRAKSPIQSVFSRFSRRQWAMLIVAGLIVLLAVLLCITINMRTNIQRQYTAARDEVGVALYDQIDSMCAIFDRVDVPGQDVQVNILPTMKQYYASVCALNTALENGFGQRYAVLTNENIAAFDSAFAEYDNAFRTGRTTAGAKDAMRQCVNAARAALEARYDGDRLKGA